MAYKSTDLYSRHEETAGRALTVSELTGRIKRTLEDGIGPIWVEGEISSFMAAASGHVYFSLKDDKSQVKAVMWRSNASRLRFKLKNGDQVLVRGSLSVYPPRGEYQIVVEEIQPRGLGALQLAFEELKARLKAEGLFDEARKRPIPFLPRIVGVVTSPTGAAIRDIIHVMRRRNAGVGIVLWPARVQGQGAAAEIAEGIRELNRWGGAEVLIVGRGGGSIEDLWAFSEEEVARAVHASALPVISAVGHEIDFTICDFVADLRAATPSAAAEIVVRNRFDLMQRLGDLDHRLRGAMTGLLAGSRVRWESAAGRRVMVRPDALLMARRQRADELRLGLARVISRLLAERGLRRERLVSRLAPYDPRARLTALRRERVNLLHRLQTVMHGRLESRTQRLAAGSAHLHALSPLAVLGRGYSICRTTVEHRVITDAATVRAGTQVNIVLQRGELECSVSETRQGGESNDGI